MSSLGSLVIKNSQWTRAAAVTDGVEASCERGPTATPRSKASPEIRLPTVVELLLTEQCWETGIRRYPRRSTGCYWPLSMHEALHDGL